MRKIIFLHFIIILSSISLSAQQRQWDRPMQLSKCSIDIKADAFIATTFIEMEFFNPNRTEIEGLYRFSLEPGQVITAFQLDLNGKYRDGSIEEKWKATNTYNSIVGKRIDPALLTMEYTGNYSLRIFPVPAGGSRKITMTIQEAFETKENNLIYSLPLNIHDSVSIFNLNISATGNFLLPLGKGLIKQQPFVGKNKKFTLSWNASGIVLDKPISFQLPLSEDFSYCVKKAKNESYFAMRFRPAIPGDYPVNPRKIVVYWDASESAKKRNVAKEVSFLTRFLSYHAIEQLTIIPFNHKLLDTVVFHAGKNFNKNWQHYLQNLSYKGATQLGKIDMTGFDPDMFLLFSDGKNTYGSSIPKTGTALVSCIYTSYTVNKKALEQVTGSAGGKVIDLNKISISDAVKNCSTAINWLINIRFSNDLPVITQTLPLKTTGSILLNGRLTGIADTIILQYGNNNHAKYTEKIALNKQNPCIDSCIDRFAMLSNFKNKIQKYTWNDLIDFGLQEKIVTPYTAYIVLERTEDYIRYNITPPSDLEEECRKLNYVKRDTRFERRKLEKSSEYDILNNIITIYNQRITEWDKNAKHIFLDRSEFEKQPGIPTRENYSPSENLQSIEVLTGNAAGLTANSYQLSEVIVTAYGFSQKKNLTYSVSSIQRDNTLTSAMSLEQALQGRVPGLQVTPSTSPSAAGTIRLRGVNSISNSTPLYVVDGLPITGNINEIVNTADIDYISVLKDAAATSLYGSRAVNGAIIIVTKKGRPYNYYSYLNRRYRLKDMEDVEYMQELKSAIPAEKETVYENLKEQYGEDPGFYLDVAQYFYQNGLQQKAYEILLTGAEVTNGNPQMLLNIAYILESWKYFDEAIAIYSEILNQYPSDIGQTSNLSWALYQAGNYQQSVDVLYNAIKSSTGDNGWLSIQMKVKMLCDMNAIIASCGDKIDVSAIPAALIKPLPVDLKIVLDCNNGRINSLFIKEPSQSVSGIDSSRKVYDYSNQNNLLEYQLKKATKGTYLVSINYYGYYTGFKIPSMIRIRKFKNFGRENQSVENENIMMDNQYGEIEISEVKW